MDNLKIVEVGEIVEGTSESGVEYKYFPAVFSAGFGLKKIARNMFMNAKGDWDRGSQAEAIQAMKDKANVAGTKVTRDVEPFTITDSATGEERTLNTHSTVVFTDESIATVFKNNGRPLADIKPTKIVVATGTPNEAVAAEGTVAKPVVA